MKVLITGASGFVGRHLMQCLTADITTLKINKEESIHVNSDTFIHLAGIPHNKRDSFCAQDYEIVNKDLTIKAFNAFLESGATKFIMMSSVKAVADEYDGIIDEETEERPITEYGKSKLAAELYMLSRQLPTGKYLYILRPALITGSGVKGNLRSLLRFSRSPFGWLLYGINNKRSYCNIKNLCFVIQEILDRDDIPSGIYMIADDEPLSTAEVVKILSKKAEMNNRLTGLLRVITHFILFIAKPIKKGSISEMIKKIASNYMVSNKKITSILGKPMPSSSVDGIRQID